MTGYLARGQGVDHLIDFIAHAAVWAVIGRFVRHSPVLVAVLVGLVAALVIVRRVRRRRPAGRW